jgi:hypothetical protein
LRRITSSGSELDRDLVHDSLERKMNLWSSEPAHRTGRSLVGHHDIDDFLHRSNRIGAGAEGMRTDRGGGHRRA